MIADIADFVKYAVFFGLKLAKKQQKWITLLDKLDGISDMRYHIATILRG